MIYRLSDEYFVRSLCEADIDGPYPTWFEDQEVCRFNSHGKFVRNVDYFRRFVQSLDGSDRLVWAICHVADGHIGNVALQSLSFVDRTGEFAIILGDRRHWGRGVAILAAHHIFHHGFNKLNLHRIYCGTAATNESMKKLAVKLGMQQEGLRRAHLFIDGERVDVVEYGILSSEYREKSRS